MSRFRPVLVVSAAAAVLLAAISGARAEPPRLTASLTPQAVPLLIPVTERTVVDRDLGLATSIAWEPGPGPGGGRLWVAYEDRKRLVRRELGPGKPKVFKIRDAAAPAPGLLAWDPIDDASLAPDSTLGRLWAVTSGRDQVIRGIETAERDRFGVAKYDFLPRPVRPIAGAGQRSRITGIAVDPTRDPSDEAEVFVACRGGGLCATIEIRRRVVSQGQSQLIAQFYANCEPLDITIDPQGGSFWVLGNQGRGRGALLLEYRIAGLTSQEKLRTLSSIPDNVFQVRMNEKPVALAATGDSLLLLANRRVDRGGKTTDRAVVVRFDPGRSTSP